MINRQNYLDTRAYLHSCETVSQLAPNTLARYRSALNHLLIWAADRPLTEARRIDPPYQTYLRTARVDGKAKTLSPVSIVKCLNAARQFFAWARVEWPGRYKPVTNVWISHLVPPRDVRQSSRLPVRKYYTLDEVLRIAAVSTETLTQERGKVAVCMLFLSGMRADALASLPLDCLDLPNRQVMQLPESGVRTKNRKAALTYLLDIPELLTVVEAWDHRIRPTFPPNALWYATLTSDGMTPTPTVKAFEGRHTTVERDVKLICTLAGLPYLSPHKLRHGHVVHAIKQAKDLEDLKAISQNVMHASVTITDSIYGNLANDDVRNTIARLGKSQTGDTDSNGLERKLDQLLELLRPKMPE